MDFRDVIAPNKDEQIRAWAIERSIDILKGREGIGSDTIVETSAEIEQYIKEGMKTDAEVS